jgi:hypothetical protein
VWLSVSVVVPFRIVGVADEPDSMNAPSMIERRIIPTSAVSDVNVHVIWYVNVTSEWALRTVPAGGVAVRTTRLSTVGADGEPEQDATHTNEDRSQRSRTGGRTRTMVVPKGRASILAEEPSRYLARLVDSRQKARFSQQLVRIGRSGRLGYEKCVRDVGTVTRRNVRIRAMRKKLPAQSADSAWRTPRVSGRYK